MKKLIIFIICTISLFAVGIDDLWVEHGLVIGEDGLFTGILEVDNKKSRVELGVVVDFTFVKDDMEVFNISVKNNRFDGIGVLLHEDLGSINAIYDEGYLTRIEGRTFYEVWENNIFVEGFEDRRNYRDISKHASLEFFDKYSFNVLQNFFRFMDKNNGFVQDKNEMLIYDDKKLIKLYTYIPQMDIEVSQGKLDKDMYLISFRKLRTAELYQARIVKGEVEVASYSDSQGPILIEYYRKNNFHKGRNYRNELVYSESQMNSFINDILKMIK